MCFSVFFPLNSEGKTGKTGKQARSNSNKNQYMQGRGGPASHIDQGRRSRFTARILLRPGSAQLYIRSNSSKQHCPPNCHSILSSTQVYSVFFLNLGNCSRFRCWSMSVVGNRSRHIVRSVKK